MTRDSWKLGILGALAVASGLAAKPVGVCVRTPTTYRPIEPSIQRSIDFATQQGTTTPPPAQGRGGGAQGGGAAQGGRGGGGRGNVAVMTLSTTGWMDGGTIPLKYSQAGDEVSPPLTWSGQPTPTSSFVLIVHDIDGMRGNDDTIHWLVWNIPGDASSLPEKMPQGPELAGGIRQISATGPYYRGPAAPASGPAHHYLFELYALDTMIDVAPVGASPADTRAAIVAAMAGHVRGKASMVGLYKRGS